MMCHIQEHFKCQIVLFYMQCYMFLKFSFNNDHFVHQTYLRNDLSTTYTQVQSIMFQMCQEITCTYFTFYCLTSKFRQYTLPDMLT